MPVTFLYVVNAYAFTSQRRDADIAQAEYFLGVLADERAELAQHVVHHRNELATYEHAGDLGGVRRKKRVLRDVEKEVAEIDRMVRALRRKVGADGLP